MSFEIMIAKDGNETLTVLIDDKRYLLHSAYYPVKEAEEWADDIDYEGESVVLVYGIGLGYHINSLIKKIDENSRLILVEPSREIFEYAFNKGYYDGFKNRPNTFFIVTDVEDDMKNMLMALIPYDNFEDIAFFKFKQYHKVFGENYDIFSKSFVEVINAMRLNRNTELYFAHQWQSNFVNNIEFVFKSTPVKRFFNVFKNVPAIIVSAGPSLDKNIKQLKEVKGRAVVICVGTALKAVLREGIEPDFVVSIDGSEKNYKHFERIVTNAPLLYDLTIYPEILETYKGPLVIGRIASELTFLIENILSSEFGAISSGPSVANVALDFAYKMGCNPVIFVGQDLAYADNRTHATGTVYENDRVKPDNNAGEYFYVEGNFGNEVLTSRSFLSFKTWFESYIGSHNDRTYINATEGGARIKGTDVMTLNDVLNSYLTKQYEINAIISNIVKTEVHIDPEKLRLLIGEFERTIKKLKILKADCKRGAKLSKKLYNYYDEKETNVDEAKILRILDKIDLRLKESKKHFAFITFMLTIVTTKVLKGFKPDKDETEKQRELRIASMSFTLYQGIYEAIEQSEDGLKNALNKLERIKDSQKISGGCINEVKR